MQTRRTLLASGVAGVAGLAGCVGAPDAADGQRDAGDGSDGTEATGESGEPTENDDDAEDDATRIGFVGDLMLGRSVNERWADDDNPENVWGSTLSRLQELDGLVGNLECCVSDRGTRWPNKGYYFRADPAFAVPALEAAGASFVSLANNHVLDYREPALRDTESHLTEAGIANAGAGTNRESALEPTVFEAGDLTVAAFGLTDQSEEFAAAESEPGTAFATLDPSVSATRSRSSKRFSTARRHTTPTSSSPRSTGDRTGRPNPGRSTRRSAGGSSIRASTWSTATARTSSRGRGVPRATDYL